MTPSANRQSDDTFAFDDALAGYSDVAYTPGQGLPLDLPFAADQSGDNTQARGLRGRSAGTNTPTPSSPPGEEKRHRATGTGLGTAELSRVSRRRLERLAAHMPKRDHRVLQLLAEHRYLTTTQIRRFVCTTQSTDSSAARTARQLTLRLSKTGLIRALGRRIGGTRPGSSATIWQLAPAGARLVREGEGNWRPHDPSPRFLRHCLAVADVHLLLRAQAAAVGVDGHTPVEREVHVETEPDCWRRYTGPGGESRWLQPDLFAQITSPEFIDRWFIEVDLGTESLPALLRKCQAYQDYYASGTEQAATETFPLVLWIFTDPERAERLERHVLRRSNLTTQMFRFAHVTDAPRVLEAGS